MIYNLSRNYGQLFDLLCRGEVVVGFAPYKQMDSLRDVVQIIRYGEFDVFIGARGTQYGGLYSYMRKYGAEKEVFLKHCENIELEWIEPQADAGKGGVNEASGVSQENQEAH